jgi:glycosyltransferase involved in cell wall biosynthesis
MTSSPRVSVVTTVYNGEPYFDRAVPGILSQTFEDFEYIIVNDGSSDRTGELLRDVAARDPRVRVLSPGRIGFCNAANLGIEQARGEIIARQDFDDRSYPDRLRLQVACLDANPKVGVVGGYYVLVDENRGERYVRMPPTQHGDIVLAMARHIPLANTFATFRRRVWVEAGGYPVVLDLEDLLFWLKAAKLGWQIVNLPEVMGEHFVHPSSFFHRTYKYADRQRNLARVQAKVVRELRLPPWMYIYAAGRYGYAHCPTIVKRAIRRTLGRSRERDL